MAEQTILIAEDDPDIRDGVLDDVTNLISTAASLASYLLKIGANSTTGVVSSVRSGSTRYETADDMQVYLWYKGKYYATTLSQINAEDYSLIGWYDAHGSAAGGKIRVLVAVKKD